MKKTLLQLSLHFFLLTGLSLPLHAQVSAGAGAVARNTAKQFRRCD
jgi:hypothetical protein